MKNEYKLPIFFLEACGTAWLDFEIFNNFRFPCFAWALLKNKYGGAIAVIGATREGPMYLDPDGSSKPYAGGHAMHKFFYEAYEQGALLSDMIINAYGSYLDNYWKDAIILETFVLLGDPSLKVGGYPL